MTAWVRERTTKIKIYLAWKAPCALVQGASNRNYLRKGEYIK
jgi:hypothetical protein